MASEEVTEVAEAVSEAAGVIERGVEAVASQIAELAATYGEPAWNTVLLIVQIDAAKSLGVAAFIFFGTLYAGKRIWRADGWLRSELKTDDGEGWFVAVFVSGILSIPAVVALFRVLLDVWNYVALFSPELYLAKRALDAVVGL